MRVIGVDLGWSTGATGLCAVEGARVLDSATARDDDAIVGWIERWRAPDVLVAFDAPLVVRNRTGRRPCEAVVAAAYAAAHAACHPANMGRPGFADGGRAARLACRLGLATAPEAVGRRPLAAAIEVYPHTALVSLFGLARTLKYKAKRGRSLEDRRREFHALLARLEALADARPALDVTTSPRWSALVDAVRGATGGGALDRVEDEIDAYVCGYTGLHHLRWRRSARSVVIGDGRTGYIVTPVEPTRARVIRAAALVHGVALG